MKIHHLHSLPIAVTTTKILTNQEKTRLYEEPYEVVTGSSTLVSKDKQLLNKPWLKQARYFMDSIAYEYIKDVLQIDNDFRMTHSWMTKGMTNGIHPLHAHKSCLFSVAHYLDGKGRLTFDFDRSRIGEGMNFAFDNHTFNWSNADRWYFNTKPKTTIIFPGWVKHEGSHFDGFRSMLGANYFLTGDVGKGSEQVDNIKL